MRIIVAITGGIAAYKACDMIIALQKTGHEVRAIMTDNAKEFVTPLTMATISKNSVMDDMWVEKSNVEHIEVGKWADAFIVYPATANVIAKFANGIADDTLSTVYLALPNKVRARTFVFPSMNTNMLNHPSTERNLSILEKDGVHISKTRYTVLVCGDEGEGGVLKPRNAVEWFLKEVVL